GDASHDGVDRSAARRDPFKLSRYRLARHAGCRWHPGARVPVSTRAFAVVRRADAVGAPVQAARYPAAPRPCNRSVLSRALGWSVRSRGSADARAFLAPAGPHARRAPAEFRSAEEHGPSSRAWLAGRDPFLRVYRYAGPGNENPLERPPVAG